MAYPKRLIVSGLSKYNSRLDCDNISAELNGKLSDQPTNTRQTVKISPAQPAVPTQKAVWRQRPNPWSYHACSDFGHGASSIVENCRFSLRTPTHFANEFLQRAIAY
jgi:hypothetical protein